jgi:pimeloyl-ACP methyl ester carboxylesterase
MLKKFLLISVCTLLALAVVGATYQSIRNDQDLERFPAPGEFYQVDGLALHLDCRGSGSPTVLFESGLTSGSLSWSLVHDDIAAQTRVCAYDRPGIDWSDPINREVQAPEVANRLHALLAAAQLADDIILVGMSAGGVYVREYYDQYPEQIVAMVLVDSSHEQQGLRLPPENGSDTATLVMNACRMVQPLGLVRASGVIDTFLADMSDQADPEFLAAYSASLNRSYSCSAIYWEFLSFAQEIKDAQPPRDLGDLPLIVLSQGNEPEAMPDMGVTLEDARAQREVWNVLQQELTALSSRGQRFVAANSGHVIQFQQPELVREKILALVQTIREE